MSNPKADTGSQDIDAGNMVSAYSHKSLMTESALSKRNWIKTFLPGKLKFLKRENNDTT